VLPAYAGVIRSHRLKQRLELALAGGIVHAEPRWRSGRRRLDGRHGRAGPAHQATTTVSVEHRLSVFSLQSIAARIRFLSAQLAELDPQLLDLITQHPAGPALLAEPGVGPVVAAQLLISWSHHGRVRNEAAFASLAGVAPLETSSGQRSRHRLNRGGDRALNRALHTVAVTRMRCHPETQAYEARRSAKGKTHRDIRRSVKRALTRRLYRTIETAARIHDLSLAA